MSAISLGTSSFGLSIFLGAGGLYTSPKGTLASSASKISLQLHSSISFPRGALAMNLTSVTCCSSLRIRSPPRSPSRSAVASFSVLIFLMVSGTFAPSRAMVLSIPHLMRLIMSALPSTMIIFSAVWSSGPAGSSSGPYFSTFPALRVSETSLKTSSTDGNVSMVHLCRMSLALSMMIFLRASLTSSIFSRVTLDAQGPTRFMASMLAAIKAVLTRSRLVGMVMVPVVLSFLECRSISILPIRPVFWSSLRSSSGPKSPSVCPKTAPITSGFSTTPSMSNLACITYFIVNVWDDPVIVKPPVDL